MKRFWGMLLCFLFLLSGCKKEPEPNLTVPWKDLTEYSSQNGEVSVEPEIVKELLAVSVPAVTERFYHESGVELFFFTSQHMQLILPNTAVAEKVVQNFLNRMDNSRADVESIISAAKHDYNDSPAWVPSQAGCPPAPREWCPRHFSARQ